MELDMAQDSSEGPTARVDLQVRVTGLSRGAVSRGSPATPFASPLEKPLSPTSPALYNVVPPTGAG